MASLTVTPLTTTIGARVDGVDLREPLSAETAQAIRDALAAHYVLAFEKQAIGLEQQQALASIFGPLEPVLSHKLVGETDSTTVLDNKLWATVDGDQLPNSFMMRDEFQEWHADSTFCPQIPSIACLRAELLPPVGGGTCWANLACAYEALSPAMREWLTTLDVIHAAPPGQRAVLNLGAADSEVQAIWERELAARRHPLVVRHEASGRDVLFVNPAFVIKIDQLSNSESAMLLRYLFNHAIRPDFIYRHRWNEGDILVWDELATIHLAPHDYLPHQRRVVRVTAGLTTPMAARSAPSPQMRAA
jgi:taurine dioxygenase